MSRLRIPLIRNQRKMALPVFERDLAASCGIIRPRYLPIEESVRLYDRFTAGSAPECASGRMGRSEMEVLLAAAQSRFPPDECGVFLRNHWYMGAIVMGLPTFCAKALDLLDFDGDTVIAMSPDGGEGIMLDFDIEPIERDGGYELFAWGSRWSAHVSPSPPPN